MPRFAFSSGIWTHSIELFCIKPTAEPTIVDKNNVHRIFYQKSKSLGCQKLANIFGDLSISILGDVPDSR